MISEFALIITSVLLGATLSKIMAKILIFQKGINLFTHGLSQKIPTLNLAIAEGKSYDIVEFALFILSSATIFTLFLFINKRIKRKYSPKTKILLGLANLIFALLSYMTVMFMGYSGIQTIIFIFLFYTGIFAVQPFIPENFPDWETNKISLFNGVSVGFYLLIVSKNFTASLSFPLVLFAVTPIYFYLLSGRFKIVKNPLFILLTFSFLYPFNKLFLLILAVVALVCILIFNQKLHSKTTLIIEKIYPYTIVFIFLYNPIFYLGTFDSVEEGFWASWLQRLIQGQFIYKDFAAYHPPFLIRGLFIFTKIFGTSLFYQRLFFHLLQILGLMIIFSALRILTKSKIVLILIFTLVVAYSSTMVRNNIEFRLGSGIVPLLFLYWHLSTQKKLFLYLAGITASLALLISLETGLASLLGMLIALLISSPKANWLKKLLYIVLGMFTILLPFIIFLTFDKAAGKFFEYIIYYASTFSSGYQNLPIERPQPQTIIQWYLVIQYLNTSGFLWELSKVSILSGLLLIIVRKIRDKLGPTEILVLAIAVFGIFISRSALGRSDQYHISFVWIPALILISYLLDLVGKYTKIIPGIVLTILIFFIGRDQTQTSLFQSELAKFQTYGSPAGQYPSYSTKRAGIITGIEANPKDTDDLITFIDNNANQNETIFVFPQEPEIYFLANRRNATSFDTPTTFYTANYQNQMIEELMSHPPKLIIYTDSLQTKNYADETLHEVNKYILENYKVIKQFGKESVMKHI